MLRFSSLIFCVFFLAHTEVHHTGLAAQLLAFPPVVPASTFNQILFLDPSNNAELQLMEAVASFSRCSLSRR